MSSTSALINSHRSPETLFASQRNLSFVDLHRCLARRLDAHEQKYKSFYLRFG